MKKSRKGYQRLGTPSEFFIIKFLRHNSVAKKFLPKFQSFLIFIGHYFFLTTHYAPLALLPTTLLYMNDNWSFIPSFVYVIIITVFFCGALYQMQDQLLYHPDMPVTARMYVGELPASFHPEEVYIPTGDNNKLHGYLIKQSNELLADAPTLVYFHGNAGNAASPSVIPLYLSCNSNVLMIDYRGYGKSSGFPSENGLYLDGEAAVRYLHSRTDINLNKIVLLGHSLGGAVAIHIASQSQWVKGRIAAVILENTFTNIKATASEIFGSFLPFLSYLPTVCFKNKFESVKKVRDINVPVLFIYGDSDTIVPPVMSRILFETAANPRSALVEIPNGTHNDTWCSSSAYQVSIKRFLDKVFYSTDASQSLSSPETSEERVALSYQWQNDVVHS